MSPLSTTNLLLPWNAAGPAQMFATSTTKDRWIAPSRHWFTACLETPHTGNTRHRLDIL